MNYNRGNGKRWYNPRNRKPWNTGYRRYGAEPWRSQNSNHIERFRFDNRRGYNPNYRDQYANQNAINYQSYNTSTAWNNHSVLNDIKDEDERRNSTFDAKTPEEAPENAVEIQLSKQSVVKTPSSKNDEQLVSSSDTVVTPSQVDAPCEEEHHNPRSETTPKSRIVLKDKLITELLKKSSSKIKDILSNPQQSNKYKAAFDALGKEKRLSSYNELQSKYPRSQPPPGNSSLINPEDSIELDQLPSDIVDKIENWLGLDQLDLLSDEVCADSKPIFEFLDPDTLLNNDNSELPDEDSLNSENKSTLGEVDLSAQITRLPSKEKPSMVENFLPENVNESEVKNNEINPDGSESLNTKETTASNSAAIDRGDLTENITQKSTEDFGILVQDEPKVLEDMSSLMGPIVEGIETKEQTEEENNTNVEIEHPHEALDKSHSDEQKVYKPCPKSKKRFEQNKIFAHVPDQESMRIDYEAKNATPGKETNEKSSDRSPADQSVTYDCGGDQKTTEKNNVQVVENIVTTNIHNEELQNSNTNLHIENENITPNIHIDTTKELQNPTVDLHIGNENVISQNIHIEKPPNPTVVLCFRNDSLQNNMSNTFRSDLPENSTYLTSDDRDIIKQMYNIEKQIQDLQNAKMKIYDRFVLAASKLRPPEISNYNTKNEKQMQDQYVQTSCKKSTNPDSLNYASDNPTSPLDSETLQVQIEKECFVTPKKNVTVPNHRRKHSPDRSSSKRGRHKITKYGSYNTVKINEKSVTSYLKDIDISPPQETSPKAKAKKSPKAEKIKKITSSAKRKYGSKSKKGTIATVTEFQTYLVDSKAKNKSEKNVNDEIALQLDTVKISIKEKNVSRKMGDKKIKTETKSDAVCSIEDSQKKLNNTSVLFDIEPIDKNGRGSVKIVAESQTDHVDSHAKENMLNCDIDIPNINEHTVCDQNSSRMDADSVCSIKEEQSKNLDSTTTENQADLIDSNVKEMSENIISDKITLHVNEEKLPGKSSSKTKSKKKDAACSKEKNESCDKNQKVSVTDFPDSHAKEKSENIIGDKIGLVGDKTIINEQIVFNENSNKSTKMTDAVFATEEDLSKKSNNSSALLESDKIKKGSVEIDPKSQLDKKVDFDNIIIDKVNINDQKVKNDSKNTSEMKADIPCATEEEIQLCDTNQKGSMKIVNEGNPENTGSGKITLPNHDIANINEQKVPTKNSSKSKSKRKADTVSSIEGEIVPCGKNKKGDSRTKGQKSPTKYSSKNRSKKKTNTVTSVEEEIVPCGKKDSIETVAENKADPIASHVKEIPEDTEIVKSTLQHDNSKISINEQKVPSADDSRTNGQKTPRKYVSKNRSKKKTDTVSSVEVVPCDKNGSIKIVAENQADFFESHAKEVPEKPLNDKIKHQNHNDNTGINESKLSRKHVSKNRSRKTDTAKSAEEEIVPCDKKGSIKTDSDPKNHTKEVPENTNSDQCYKDKTSINEQKVSKKDVTKSKSKRKSDTACSKEERNVPSTKLPTERLVDVTDRQSKEKSEHSISNKFHYDNVTSGGNEQEVLMQNGSKKSSKRKADAVCSVEEDSCKKLNKTSNVLGIQPLDQNLNSSENTDIEIFADLTEKSENTLQQDSNKTGSTEQNDTRKNKSKRKAEADCSKEVPCKKLNNMSAELEIVSVTEVNSSAGANMAPVAPTNETKPSSNASKKSSRTSKTSITLTNTSDTKLNVAQLDPPPKESKKSSSASKKSSSSSRKSSSSSKKSSSASKSSSSTSKKSSSGSKSSSSTSKRSSSESKALPPATNSIVTEEIVHTNETSTSSSASEAQIAPMNESKTDSCESEAPIRQEEDSKASSNASKASAVPKNCNKTSPIASKAIIKTPNARMSTRNTKNIANTVAEDIIDYTGLNKTENSSLPAITSHEIADTKHEIIQDITALSNKPKKTLASQISNIKPQNKYNLKECSIILERYRSPSHANAAKTDEKTNEIVKESTITNAVQEVKEVEMIDNATPPSNQQNFIADECALAIGQNDLEMNLSKISFEHHHEPIIALCLYQSMILAASEDGYIYIYNKDNGVLENTLGKHFGAVTGIEVYHGVLYTIGLDGSLQYADMESCMQSERGLHKLSILSKLSGPAQAFCISWNQIYIGTRTGHVDIYDIQKNELVNTLNAGHSSILSMVCSQEGPRKIILVASKEKTLSVRDAQTGLLLRDMIYPSMENPNVSTNMLPAIYCLLLYKAEIYCGTSGTNIEVYNFTSGERVCGWPGGRGTVCMIHHRGLLFSGCYDGNVYVHRMTNGTLVGKMKGPGKMLLCIRIVDDKIIAGTKDNALVLWKISDEICKEMAQC